MRVAFRAGTRQANARGVPDQLDAKVGRRNTDDGGGSVIVVVPANGISAAMLRKAAPAAGGVVRRFELKCQLVDDLGLALRSDTESGQVRADVGPPVGHWLASRVTDTGHLIERIEELTPDPPAFAQHGSARRGQAIEAPPPLAGLLDPAAFDPPLLFEFVEQRIERGGLEFQALVRPVGDQLANLVAVSWRAIEDGEDQELGATFLEGPGGQVSWCHIG